MEKGATIIFSLNLLFIITFFPDLFLFGWLQDLLIHGLETRSMIQRENLSTYKILLRCREDVKVFAWACYEQLVFMQIFVGRAVSFCAKVKYSVFVQKLNTRRMSAANFPANICRPSSLLLAHLVLLLHYLVTYINW